MSEGSYPNDEGFSLLNQFENIFESDPLMDELGFLHPSQFASLDEESSSSLKDQTSESSAKRAFWNRDHKLGISTQILLPLYNAAKNAFLNAITKYRMLSNSLDESANERLSCTLESEVMNHSRALLLLSCDFGTAWNARRLVLAKKLKLSMFKDELLLSGLILSYSPKSEQSWNHRRWIIKMLAVKFQTLEEVIENESELVEKIAERSKMNYRAWNHRCWLVSYMTSEQVLHELKISKTWTSLHVADSSCFHYRRRLMLKILDSCNKTESVSSSCNARAYQIWKEELDWNKELIDRYVGRESLWLHRRFLSFCWFNHFGTEQPGAVPSQTGKNFSVEKEFASFMDDEICFLKSSTNVPDKEFEDFQAQALYASTYMLWLTKKTPLPWRTILGDKTKTELKAILQKLSGSCALLFDNPQDKNSILNYFYEN